MKLSKPFFLILCFTIYSKHACFTNMKNLEIILAI